MSLHPPVGVATTRPEAEARLQCGQCQCRTFRLLPIQASVVALGTSVYLRIACLGCGLEHFAASTREAGVEVTRVADGRALVYDPRAYTWR